MPKIDRIKKEIDSHEKMFFGALAALLALIGWLSNNYSELKTLFVFISILIVFSTVGFGIYQYRQIKGLLQELEDD